MAKNPFKVGDRVYVYPYGWGEIMNARSSDIEIDINEGSPIYAEPCRVSFTEYDPLKGGLSHERPEEKKRPTIDTSKFFETNDVDREMIRRNALNKLADNLNKIAKAADEASKERSIKFAVPFGKVDSHGDVYAKGCFDSNFVKAMKDVPVAGSGRGRKALNYIKKLLKDNYNVVEDFISVEELGDEVQVSLTFRKG